MLGGQELDPDRSGRGLVGGASRRDRSRCSEVFIGHERSVPLPAASSSSIGPMSTAASDTTSSRQISAAHARRFLIRRHLLEEPRSLPPRAGIGPAGGRSVGQPEFDPLDVPGARQSRPRAPRAGPRLRAGLVRPLALRPAIPAPPDRALQQGPEHPPHGGAALVPDQLDANGRVLRPVPRGASGPGRPHSEPYP